MPVNSGQESKSAARPGAFYYGRQLNICPADELVFVVDNTGKDVFDVIVITNTLVHTVAFKVGACLPALFPVRLVLGLCLIDDCGHMLDTPTPPPFFSTPALVCV